jgi:mono/diheme cytochrome c family protein
VAKQPQERDDVRFTKRSGLSQQGIGGIGEVCVIRVDYRGSEKLLRWRELKGMLEIMKQTKALQLTMVLGMGLFMVACGGEGGEGPIVAPPQAPAEWADKHMPAGWWADPAKMEEGRKLYIGQANPDVDCGSCHGKDGKPTKAGARDFRVGERMKLYSDSVWAWRIADGVPNTKMKGWKSKLSEEDVWKLVLFEASFGMPGKRWDAEKKSWVDVASASTAPAPVGK